MNAGICFTVNSHACLSSEDNKRLCNLVTLAEIQNIVKNINPYKTPGPNGIQVIFYHNYWNIVGDEVCRFVKNCFLDESVPKEINRTLIALIPKIDQPTSVNQFRPISLCNVGYKIVTKIIIARLRPLLIKIISPFQSSFIPGRSTNDNIIVTQEILHTFRSKKGGMLFKLDLEKAYAKVSWKFLLDTLIFFNLNPSWTALIMSCVTTVSTSILWNGETLDAFSRGCGLRQGDPLSPYLFVLYMECLSILINQKAEEGKWKGIKASRNTNPLTHLFFADDLILFGQDSISSCNVMMRVINEFCSMSGQTISLAKSKLYVSPDVSRNKARRLSGVSGIPFTYDLGKYLGIPLLHKSHQRSL